MQILERVRLLERRMDRVEGLVGLKPMIVPDDQRVDAPIQQPVAKPTWERIGDEPSHAPAQNAIPLDLTHAPAAREVTPVESPPPLPIEPLRHDVLSYVTSHPKKPEHHGALEQTIGLKWAGWIGAVVLLIGAALGVKYAYDQHWFGHLPLWVWPSMIAVCGFALIGAGEYVYRKVNVIPAASLFGAGVATLFLVSYIGHSYYDLYSPGTAFVLMALTTLIGSAVAMRGKLVSIGVLSLIGGNVAPLVMGDTGAPHSTFMTYLLMLQVIALTLAWWGRMPRWWALRGVSLDSVDLWMLGIVAAHRDGMLPLWFGIGYAMLYQIEVIASAVRADRAPQKTRSVLHGGAVFVALVIGGLTAVVLGVLHDQSPWVRASWLIALSVVSAVVGLLVRNRQRKLTSSLAPSYAACATALVTLAVPVALNGMSVEIGWATLAIVAAAIARRVGSKMAHLGAVVMWMLALLHLVLTLPAVDTFHTPPQEHIWLTIHGVQITSAMYLAWGLALVGQILALLMSVDEVQSNQPAITVGAFASLIFLATSIASLPVFGATFLVIVYAWVLLGADRARPSMQWSMHGAFVLVAATAKWFAVDTLGQRLSETWSAGRYLPVLNPLVGVGLLLAGSIVALHWIRSAKPRAAGEKSHIWMIALFIIAWMGTFEIERFVILNPAVATPWRSAQFTQIAWTMWWTMCAAGGFVLARSLDRDALPSARWAKLLPATMVMLAAKFVLFDALGWRVLHGATPALVVANIQCLAAAMIIGALILLMVLGLPGSDEYSRELRIRAGFISAFLALLTLSLEVDRFFESAWASSALTDPRLAKQVAFSILWSIFAVGCVGIGFRIRLASLRYLGLGLLAVTLLKVVTVDMAQVSKGYRALSFLGVGMLMLGTSVLYGKLSPVLLKQPSADPNLRPSSN